MLQVEVSRKLRELTPEELELVAGGGITITGQRDPDPNFSLDDLWFQVFGWDFGTDAGGGSGSTGSSDPTPTDPNAAQHAENTKAAAEKVSAVTAALQDIVNHYGPNVMIQTANGPVPASEMLHGLGELSTLIQGAATLAQIENGDADVHAAFSFAFGVAVESMAADAGLAAVPAYVMGLTAQTVSDNIVNWLDDFRAANAYYSAEIDQELQQYLVENGYTPPGANDNPVDVIRGMLGMPPEYRDGTTPYYYQ